MVKTQVVVLLCAWIMHGVLAQCEGELDEIFIGGQFRSMDTSPDGFYECVWRIQQVENKQLQLLFENLDIFTTADCKYAYLKIMDKIISVRKFCGYSSSPEGVMSVSRPATAEVIVGIATLEKRLNASFSTAFDSSCAYLVSMKGGRVGLNGINNGSDTNVDCVWKITGTDAAVVDLLIETVDFEQRDNCSFHNREGHIRETLTTPTCDPDEPLEVIFSTTNAFYIRLTFEESGCLVMIMKSEILNRPLVNQNGSRISCTFLFTFPMQPLKVEFRSFDVEDERQCAAESLELDDGFGGKIGETEFYCGSAPLPVYMLASYNFMVDFVTNETGFMTMVGPFVDPGDIELKFINKATVKKQDPYIVSLAIICTIWHYSLK